MNGPKLGHVLLNGAIVIASHSLGEDEFVVLAHYGDDEYVTWRCHPTTGGRRGGIIGWECHWGHYFQDITEAAIDFRERCGGDLQESKEQIEGLLSAHH